MGDGGAPGPGWGVEGTRPGAEMPHTVLNKNLEKRP